MTISDYCQLGNSLPDMKLKALVWEWQLQFTVSQEIPSTEIAREQNYQVILNALKPSLKFLKCQYQDTKDDYKQRPPDRKVNYHFFTGDWHPIDRPMSNLECLGNSTSIISNELETGKKSYQSDILVLFQYTKIDTSEPITFQKQHSTTWQIASR